MSTSLFKLNFYSPQDEVIKTYARNGVPAGVMRKAMKLQEQIGGKESNEVEQSGEMMDEIAMVIVEMFGDQFTMDELYKHSYFSEWFPLITQMFALTKQVQQQYFPTTAPAKKVRRRS